MEQDALVRQQEFFNRARKGVLKYLNEQGGMLSLGQLHDHSMNKFLIQHQRFSQMMEGFVSEALVIFDESSQDVIITHAGKNFIALP